MGIFFPLIFICLCHTLKITGGSSGIGKALAAEALQKGASTVVLVARNQVNNNQHILHFHSIYFNFVMQERLKTAKAELDNLIAPGTSQVG